MDRRLDVLTSSRIDLAVVFLPAITWLEASCMLAVSGVAEKVASWDIRRAGRRAGRTTLWTAIERAFTCGDVEIRRFTLHDTRSTPKGHMRNTTCFAEYRRSL